MIPTEKGWEPMDKLKRREYREQDEAASDGDCAQQRSGRR